MAPPSSARGLGVGNLGAVCNFEHAIPADGSEASAAATRRHDALINRWFVSALFNRQYPEEALDGIAPHLPSGWEKDLDRIAQPLDWFGINYYTRKLVAAAPGPGRACPRWRAPCRAPGWAGRSIQRA